ncbi:uncharacterized protein LOC107821824 [Nicotiana tabacum]|uniref:Uncharacterized protein LOC107821824 n=1 Tax=Nicotiana tabacum TaxID=4097 RepID=A0A1S4CRN6_TOBAC|nr:PREDICTED: uncharacterized protein LOC107821824 [Nicotiana tabacum]
MDTPKQACWIVKKIFDTRQWFLKKHSRNKLEQYHRNGKFNIKKLYIVMRPQFQKIWWKKITTGSKAIPKYRFILWLALYRRVATVDRLRRWGSIVDNECVLCDTNEEKSMEHLWFGCSYAKTIWSKLLHWLNETHQIGNWDEKIRWLKSINTSKARGEVLVFLFTAMVYHVWT